MFPSKPNGNDSEDQPKIDAQLRRRMSMAVVPSPHSDVPKRAATEPRLYEPSVYSYSCKGLYAAKSDNKHGEEGICKGLRSKLEVTVIAQQQEQDSYGDVPHEPLKPEVVTRAKAIRQFTDMANDEMDSEYENGSAAGDYYQKTKTAMLPPTLIFKQNYWTTNENGEQQNIAASQMHPEDVLPEEELIDSEEWKCIGSTEVEYLVLKDVETGKRTITAVTPHTVGVSRRKIAHVKASSSSEQTIRSITRLGLGVMDVIHDETAVMVEVDENEQTNDAQEQSRRNQKDDTPWMDWEKFSDFGMKVGENSVHITKWLWNNVSDEFPTRTYRAGCRILKQVPTTIEITASSTQSLLQLLLGIEREKDDDSGVGKRK